VPDSKSTTPAPPTVRIDKISHFQDLLRHPFPKGYRLELRIPRAQFDSTTGFTVRRDVSRDRVAGGWFGDPRKFSHLVANKCSDVSCYVQPNLIPAAKVPAGKLDKLMYLHKGQVTTVKDLNLIKWLIVDIDPKRYHADEVLKKGVLNSTDAEMQVCIRSAERIVKDLRIADHSLIGTSGNGGFLMIRVDLGNTSADRETLRRFVAKLILDYSHEYARIDPYDPVRGLPIPGTIKFKADRQSEDRPYRRVELIWPPDVAGLLHPISHPSAFDVRAWVECNVPDGPRAGALSYEHANTSPPTTHTHSPREGGGGSRRTRREPREWLDRQDPAIDAREPGGGGGRAQTRNVIYGLVTRFRLDREEVERLFWEHYDPRCLGSWGTTQEDIDEVNGWISTAFEKRDEWRRSRREERRAAREARSKASDLEGWTMPDWTKDNPLFGGK
jgi:hypothetical protein